MSAARATLTIPILAAVAFAATLGWFAYERFRPHPPAERGPEQAGAGPTARPDAGVSRPGLTPSGAEAAIVPPPPQPNPAQPAATPPPARPDAIAALPPAPAPSASQPALPPRPDRAEPTFDIVRVEPSGDSVIAGRAAPGATVELTTNGRPLARAVADAAGQFAFMPPALPPGTHELALEAASAGAEVARSGQSVTVVVAANRSEAPLVTVTRPGQPTVVLSRPEEPAPRVAAASPPPPAGAAREAPPVASGAPSSQAGAAAEAPRQQPGTSPQVTAASPRPTVSIATVEAEGSGRLYVSGLAAPGATLRLYLNDAFVAPGATAPDGRLAFAIERGIRPGDYRVRLDDVDPATGEVRSRAEVPFNVPAPVLARAEPPLPPPAARPPMVETGTRSTAPALPAADTAPPRDRLAAVTEPALPAGGLPGAAAAPPAALIAGPATPQAPSETTAPRDPAAVVVPEVNTATVVRGDNLWRISKRTYGQGLRYTVIYGANTPQIRNPHRIYPGQIFVLPNDGAEAVVR